MQNFENHTRWDPWYHFFLSPIALMNVLFWGMKLVREPGIDSAWSFIVSLAIVAAVFKLRLNALKVQDRVIRLEERLRLRELAPGLDLAWSESLTADQWIGLRFASDAELVELARRAANEKLEQDQIKEAIRHWRPDDLRV